MNWTYLAIGAAVGVVVFLAHGHPMILDASHVGWLARPGDHQNMILGWEFFRRDVWRWPPGANPTYGLEHSSSIVFTDSIPLLAIPLKAIVGDRAGVFQFFGAWVLFVLVLQGAAAALLLSRFTRHWEQPVLGAFLLTLAPIIYWRIGGHFALAAHGFLLLALWISLRTDSERPSTIAWTILLVASLWTHLYLGAMVFVLLIASYLDYARQTGNWPNAAGLIVALAALVFLVMFVAGYFTIAPSTGLAEGFGWYSANLVGLFDPATISRFFGDLPSATPGQTWEGFLYLGAGGILLALISIGIRQAPWKIWPNRGFFWAFVLALFIFSLSQRITLGSWTLITLPDWLYGPFGHIFRSTARMAWPIYYVILVWSVVSVSRHFSRTIAAIILSAAAVLQYQDLRPLWSGVHANLKYTKSLTYAFTPETFAALIGSRKKLISVPAFPVREGWFELGLLAAQHGVSTNLGQPARADLRALEHYSAVRINALAKGEIPEEELWLIPLDAAYDMHPTLRVEPLGHTEYAVVTTAEPSETAVVGSESAGESRATGE